MTFEYLEHTSDVRFRVWAESLDRLFADAIDATANVMVASLDSIRAETSVTLSVSADALDLLLVKVLDELIFHKDAEGLLLRASSIQIEPSDGSFRATGVLRGESIDRERHELAADVKAVTLHGLYVKQIDAQWEAQVTLDV